MALKYDYLPGSHTHSLICMTYGCNYTSSQLIRKTEKNMNVVSKLKQLALNKDDRLLRQYEIVSDCGELTEDGQEVLWGILLESHKAELVSRVKELDEEEKTKKKASK